MRKLRYLRRNECYAVVKRYGKAFLIIHNLKFNLSEVYGMHSNYREARKHKEEINSRLHRRRAL